MSDSLEEIGRRLFPLLAVLILLFVFRVVAQLLQAVFPLSFLPPFDSWHSGVLPYPFLVAAQLLILMGMGVVALKVRSGTLAPGRWRYTVCFVLGGAYFVFMLFRLVAGFTFLSHVAWFSVYLPTLFHLVLAVYILGVGYYLYRSERVAREGHPRLNIPR